MDVKNEFLNKEKDLQNKIDLLNKDWKISLEPTSPCTGTLSLKKRETLQQ